MRLILAAALAVVPVALAQNGHSPTGSYGNVLHPGVPSPGALRAPAPAAPPAPAQPGGGWRFGAGTGPGGGRTGGNGFGNGRTAGGRRNFGGAVYVPYPIYGGYGTGYAFDGFYANDNNPGPGYADATPPPPTVIINQNFQTDSVRPQFRDYSNVQLPEPGAAAPPAAGTSQQGGALADDQPTIFLIAMQDHTIHPVIAYWVQEDKLHYVTREGVLDQVNLAQVDRDFSKQLNAERNVPFALPAAH